MDKKARGIFVGQRIRAAREALGWSQDTLADELDTNQGTVARWESGSFPARIGLPKIAQALRKPSEWFTTDSPEDSLLDVQARIRALEQIIKENSSPQAIQDSEEMARLRIENERLTQEVLDLQKNSALAQKLSRLPQDIQAIIWMIIEGRTTLPRAMRDRLDKLGPDAKQPQHQSPQPQVRKRKA